jgi:hypothetical protein
MKKIILLLRKLFAKSKLFAEKYVHPSVDVVNALKQLIDSPVVPLITAIIPGTLDDVIAARVKQLLPEVLKVLGFVEDCIDAKNGDTVLQCAIAKIRLFNETRKDAAWHNIATLLSQYLSDGKLSGSEAIHLAEMSYKSL